MADMDKVEEDLLNSAFLVFVNYRADSVPGTSLAGKATRLLLDEGLGRYITNTWTVNTAVCSPKAILFERHPTADAVLVISNTQEYYNLRGDPVQSQQHIDSLFNELQPTVETICGIGYRLCLAGHNYAGQVAKQLAQRWNVAWIALQTPMLDNERHIPRDYIDYDYMSNDHVKAIGMVSIFDDLTDRNFNNFHHVTVDQEVTVAELRELAITRHQLALERAQAALDDNDEDEPMPDVDAGEAALRNNEVQAVNQQQPMSVVDDILGARANIGEPRMPEQELPYPGNVGQENLLPVDINFNDMQPPEITVSVPEGGVGIKTTIYSESNYVPPPDQKQQGSFIDYLADLGATYERDVTHEQGVGGQDISRTAVTPQYTTLAKNTNPSQNDPGLAAHEKLATSVFHNKPDEAVVSIKNQTTVATTKKRFFGLGGRKTTFDTTKQGLREERTTAVHSDIVNSTQGPEYATTSQTEEVQLDHVDRNGNIKETLRGRTMTDQTLYARQDGTAYDTHSSTTVTSDGSKVIKNETDQQRSDVKQTTYDAANKMQKTLETQNMHGTSTTTVIGPNMQSQDTNKVGLVTQNVREQQVVTQQENYIDQRGHTETNHSTGQSSTTTTERGVKRTAVGVQRAVKITSTARKTQGILTEKIIVKSKTEQQYTKNNNNIKYTNNPTQLKQVVIHEKPAAGAKALFANTKQKTTTHADGRQEVKQTQSLNLAAQQGLAVGTAELLDKTLEMIDLYKKGKLNKTAVATSMTKLFTNVGEAYFAGHAANLLTTMESHLDALGLSLATVVGSSLLRCGINWFASKSKDAKQDSDDKALAKLSPKAELCIDIGGVLARSGLYYITLGAEFAFNSPIMFGASQIISAGQQVVTALVSEKMTVKEALVSIAPKVGISVASSLVSMAVAKGVTYCLGAALGGTLALSALTIIIPTLAFWATSKVLTKYLVSSAEEKELDRLLKKYGLDPKTADISAIKKEYRRLCLEKHPDKIDNGGSKEAFQILNADFDKITALHMLREAPKQGKNDPKHASVFQTAYFKLRQVITYFRSKGIEQKDIEPVFERLESDIQQAAADISDVKLEFFAQLTAEFNGLQAYEQKFQEKGYDNLAHLLQIVDDEKEFDKLCRACDIKDGHASQLRIALRKIKNLNVPNANGAN